MLVVILFLICCSIVVHAATPSLAIAMMCRDEEVNLKTNLEKWLPYADYFVFVVDKRTIDKSVETIESILTRGKKQYKIVFHEFVGFGLARTVSLTEAWNNFPQATHILIADPDWIPRPDTINLQELDVDAEVYRFVVFDRNGVSRRKMDWLLKHRAGLAMKYHLHEVLDIGTYTKIQPIGWIIDEIEKPGTWHSTVGHQHSMSLKRYEFDLEMLRKDEQLYPNDAHTDYYLGITSQAVAEALHKMGEPFQDYMEDGIYYMRKRIDTHYDSEFVDERWASMYLLGLSYVNLAFDFEKAVHMFSLCRDFNPASLECGIALTRIYLSHGVFDVAMNEMNTMLKQETKERDYLMHFKQNVCEIPELVVNLFSQKAISNILGANEAKYLLLMSHMWQNKMCGEGHSLPVPIKDVVNVLLKEDHASAVGTSAIKIRVPPLTAESSVETLCGDPGLQSYLMQTKYRIHPCDSLRPQLELSAQCSMFSFNLPPANEEMQSNSDAKEFVGAALMTDIIHHVYKGNSGRIFNTGHKLRLLFASYFNPKVIYNLVGFFDRTGFSDYEIVVVVDDAGILSEIQNTLKACSITLKYRQPTITYQQSTALEYLRSAVARKRYQISGSDSSLFDYIEYTYGVSISEEYESELSLFKQLLQPNGVIGLTYFANNHHVDKIRRATSIKNTSALIPFCMENSRFIKSYLDLNGMSFLTKDQPLLLYLGAESAPTYCTTKVKDVPPSLDWKGYSQSEVLKILDKQGLTVAAWMPRAYAHPYDEIDFHQIQQFAAMGMSQEHFVEEYLTFFRYTLYVQGSAASSEDNHKAVVSVATLNDKDLAEKVLVIDRIGTLSASFAGTIQRAASGLATTFAFAPYSMTGKVSLSKIVLPAVTPCLTQLSAGLSVQKLHEFNVKFIKDNGLNVTDEASMKTGLVSLLTFLEMTNAITFLCDRCDVVVPAVNTSKRGRVLAPAPQTATKAFVVDTHGSVVSNRAETFDKASTENANVKHVKHVKIGGLSFKVNEKSATTSDTQGTTVTAEASSSVSSNSQEDKPASPAPYMLDTEVQIKRMKALGFSDAKIADTLAKRAASKASSGTDSTPQLSTDLNGKKIPLSGSSGVNSPSNVKADSSKPHVEVAGSASETKEDATELKKKLKGILNVLHDKEKKSSSVPSANVAGGLNVKIETGSASSSSPVRPEGESQTVSGGLLQKRAMESKARLEEAKKASEARAAAKSGVSGSSSASSLSDNEILQKAKLVKLPANVQSRTELIASYRRIECFHFALDSKALPSDCQLSGPVRRKTSMLGVVSTAKLDFDMAQFRYLQRNNMLSTRLPLSDMQRKYQEVAEFVKNRKPSELNKLAKMALSSLPASTTGMLNRVVQVSSRDADPNNLVHLGAVKYIQSIADSLTADFNVVDVLLKESALLDISKALLSSTIWFDTSNGVGFVSHHDDGLILESIRSLSQLIAFAVSTPSKSMRVLKYYTVAMNLDQPGSSAVAMANGEEMVAILWLNPTSGTNSAASAVAEGETPVEDGLRIFDDFAAGRLYSQGVSIYPSAHSDFFSKSGDLAINMTARCNVTNSELVPRKTNRLVLLQPKRPFYFAIPSVVPENRNQREDEFESRTMIALVVFLGK